MTSKSATIIEAERDAGALPRDLPPVHPGEVLLEEFMRPLGLSSNALARHIGVPGNRISGIVAGKRAVSGDTALRLAAALGTSAEFWINLQGAWELAVARERFGGGIGRV